MAREPYNKDYATPEEVVRQLQNRGLNIPDPNKATEDIRKMGYARLRIYMETRCNSSRKFPKSVAFDDVLELHEYDSKLRATCFEPVGFIEILFRNEIAEELSRLHGSHPYEFDSLFNGPYDRENTISEFTTRYEIALETNPDGLACQYQRDYSEPYLPPIWYMKEMLTFNEIIKLFKRLNSDIRMDVTMQFGLDDPDRLINWMNAFNELRNVCAHHERLFNRVFYNVPGRFEKREASSRSVLFRVPNDGVQRDKLAGVLQCLDYVLSCKFRSMNVESSVRNIVEKSGGIIESSEIGYL